MGLLRGGGGRGAGLLDAEALVLANDCGFSAMSWWVTTASLRVSIPGGDAVEVRAGCTVHRNKSLLAGSVLPVRVDPTDPDRLEIRWEEVPTIEQRVAAGDPVILDPEGTWESVAASRATDSHRHGLAEVAPGAGQHHPWGTGRLDGWPPEQPLADGRRPATALVVASSIDSRGYRAADDWHFPVSRYAGTIYDTPHEYLGWLVLCIVPESGRRYGLHVRRMLRGGRLGAVLPIAIDASDPTDIEIPWLYAPDMIKVHTEQMVDANRSALAEAEGRLAGLAAAGDGALAAIDDPAARARAEEMLQGLGIARGQAPAPGGGASEHPDTDVADVLARLQRLRESGVLTEEEYRAEAERLNSAR